MRIKIIVFIAFFSVCWTVSGGNFDDLFEQSALRIDYVQFGNYKTNFIKIKDFKKEPIWSGNKKSLLPNFDLGQHKVMVFDKKTNNIIYLSGFSSLFHEWKHTEEAKEKTKEFEGTITLPFPKSAIKIVIYNRDKKNRFHKIFETKFDPNSTKLTNIDYLKYKKIKVHYSGDPENNLDLVIIGDRYYKKDKKKYKSDLKRFAQYLLKTPPYSENKDKINIWGIDAYSEKAKKHNPNKKTLLNTSFNTYNSDRYLMTENYYQVRNIAANAPYDHICILVNSSKYGGGAIYNYYSVCSSDNTNSEFVFTHELGHGLVGLADEYTADDEAFRDFYSFEVEPWEPNITTLVNFDKKWKNMVKKNTKIPTPESQGNSNIAVGAFEGGGYVKKGIYRPTLDCSMRSVKKYLFCPVCTKAITEMIYFYSPNEIKLEKK